MPAKKGAGSKNIYIELLRFIFCIVIFIHHSATLLPEGATAILPNGAIAVEFFFMVSGYLAMKHIGRLDEYPKDKMCYSMKYSVGKIIKVFPYAAVATVLLYIFFMGLGGGGSFADKVLSLKNMPAELTFLSLTGLIPVTMTDIHNTPLWFLSALLIALPIVMYLAMRFEDVFKGFLAWFMPPVIFAFLSYKWGTLFCWGSYDGFLYGGVIRGIADLTLGFSAYYAVKFVNEKVRDKVIFKVCMTVISLALMALVIKFTFTEHYASDQILITYCIWIMVIISFSDRTYTNALNKLPFAGVIAYLGSLAMPIYCIHWAVYIYMNHFTAGMNYGAALALDFGIAFLASVVLKLLIEKVLKRKA